MTRIIGLALLALSAANLGGNHGRTTGADRIADNRLPYLQVALDAAPHRPRADPAGLAQRQRDTPVERVRIHNLSADGIATPEPVVVATAVSGVTPTPEPTQDAPVFGAGVEQWRGLVASIFPAWAVSTVLRIMRCESNGDPNATGAAGERGLMQIHPIHHDSTYDPYLNLIAAFRISEGGTNWSAWSCA